LTRGNKDIYPRSFTHEVQSIFVEVLGEWDPATLLVIGYEGELTPAIAFVDALSNGSSVTETLAARMEAALENLTNAQVVHVACHLRTGKDGLRSGVEWLITFMHVGEERTLGAGDISSLYISSQNSVISPVLHSSDITGNANLVTSVTEVVKGTSPLRVILKDATPGLPYFVRVIASNTRGYGEFSGVVSGYSTCQPTAPSRASSRLTSNTSALVSFGASLFNGGEPIDTYRVQWFAGSPVYEVQTVTIASNDGIEGVQDIVLVADAALSGEFVVQVDGVASDAISFDASELEMQLALERTGMSDAVSVQKLPAWKPFPVLFTLAEINGTSWWAGVDPAEDPAPIVAQLLEQGLPMIIRIISPDEVLDETIINQHLVVDGTYNSSGFEFIGSAELATITDPNALFRIYAPTYGAVWRVTFQTSRRTGTMPHMDVMPTRTLVNANTALSVALVQAPQTTLVVCSVLYLPRKRHLSYRGTRLQRS
jgi:hypothetical protein